MKQRRRGSRDGQTGRNEPGWLDKVPRRPEPLVTPARTLGPSAKKFVTEPPPLLRRSRAAHHPFVLALNLVLTLVVLVMLGAGAALLFGRQAYSSAGPLPENRAVLIDRGASVEAIAAGLEERGVISNRYVFMAAAWGSGASTRMQAGEYLIPARASMGEVLDRIVSGRVVQHAITIAEGLTSAQVVQRLTENPVLTGTITTIPDEGSLLPETYLVTRGTSRQRIIELMQQAHTAALEEIWAGREANLPVTTPQELVTLASIVEKETGLAAERPLVAGVFVNRLRRGMRLQSDPTILYGLYGGNAWSEPRTIFRADIERRNPYNTYQIDGLPPGPIANPGRDALAAVARPEETGALYFVADGTGGHAFATSLAEHNRNVERWRAIERERQGAAPGTTD